MNKRGLFTLSILILSLNLISAYGGGFGDLLDNFGTENIVLIASFLISFAFIFYILGKFFKENNVIPGVIAVASAFLITQGINKFDIGFRTRIYFNLSDDLFNTIIGAITIIAAIVLIIYLTKRWIKSRKYSLKPKKLPMFNIILFLVGAGLIALGIFGDIYNSIVLIVTGVVLILLSLFAFKGKKEGDYNIGDYKEKKSSLSIIFFIIGLGLLVLGFFLGNIYLILTGAIILIFLTWRNWSEWKDSKPVRGTIATGKYFKKKGIAIEAWKQGKREVHQKALERQQLEEQAYQKKQMQGQISMSEKNLENTGNADVKHLKQLAGKGKDITNLYEEKRKKYINQVQKAPSEKYKEIATRIINYLDETYSSWKKKREIYLRQNAKKSMAELEKERKRLYAIQSLNSVTASKLHKEMISMTKAGYKGTAQYKEIHDKWWKTAMATRQAQEQGEKIEKQIQELKKYL